MEENVETSSEKLKESGGPKLLSPEDYTARLSELRKKTNNPLFKNELIRELSESSDMKKFLDSKGIKFETLSEFTHGGFIDKYTQELNVLEVKKQTVIIKYKTKVNEIDTLNNNNLVAEFDSIFSKFNYK